MVTNDLEYELMRLRPQPGDRLVVTAKRPLSDEQRMRIGLAVLQWLELPGIRVAVVDHDLRVSLEGAPQYFDVEGTPELIGRCECYVDGVRRKCVQASVPLGYAIVIECDERGVPRLNAARNAVLLHRVYGAVEIRRTDAQRA